MRLEPIVWDIYTTDRGKVRKVVGPVVDGVAPICLKGRTQYSNNWKIPFKCGHCSNVSFKSLKLYAYYQQNNLAPYCSRPCAALASGVLSGFRLPPKIPGSVIDGVYYESKRINGRYSEPYKCVTCEKVFYRIRKTINHKVTFCSKKCQNPGFQHARRRGITIDEYHNAHRLHYVATQKNRTNSRYSGDLSLDDVIDLWLEQGRRCAITGLPMTLKFLPSTYAKGRVESRVAPEKSLFQASLDRKNNEIGYTKSNCHLVCLGYNYLKNDLTDACALEFLEAFTKQHDHN